MLKPPTGRSTSFDPSRGEDTFTFGYWDLTHRPTKNDRLAKLGKSGLSVRGVAISAQNDETKETRIGYGFTSPKSYGILEPDNMVFLLHENGECTWAHRDIVDNENGSWTLAERSDIVTNQKQEMCWAYKKDQQCVVEIEKVGAPIPKGREFNGAGFLSSLYADSGKAGTSRAKSKVGATFLFPTQTPKGLKLNPVETPSRGKIRGVLATNICQNAGYVSDLNEVGQFHQLFGLAPIPDPPPESPFKDVVTHSNQGGVYRPAGGQSGGGVYRPAGGVTGSPYQPGGETVAGRENKPVHESAAGKSFNGSDPVKEAGGKKADCMVKVRRAALRGDVWYEFRGRVAQIAMEESNPVRGDDAYYGHFWLGSPSPWAPKFVPANNESSDQPRLPTPDAPEGLRPVVYIPRATHTPPPCEVQPHFDTVTPTYSTTGVLPPAHTGGSADAGEWVPPSLVIAKAGAVYEFKAGKVTTVFDSFAIPSTRVDMKYFVDVPYQLPTNIGSGDQMDFRFFYKVVAGPGELVGDNWIELSKSLHEGDNPTSADQVKMLTFEIPRIHMSRVGGGGRIHYRFMRRSDDSSAEKFRVVGNIQSSYAPYQSHARPRTRRIA